MTPTPPPVRTVTVAPDGSALTLEEVGQTFHALWLRDACQCHACRRPSTNERLLRSDELNLDIGIQHATLAGAEVTINFTDGHQSTLSLAFLAEHDAATARRHEHPAGEHRLWGRPDPESPVASFVRSDLAQPETHKAWLDAVWFDGLALVTNVDPTDAGLRGVAELIGWIMPDNLSETWSITANLDPYSAVDSTRPLLVHTDLPYREAAPGLQLLLAAATDVEGGASTFVDGFAQAERLRTLEPDAWQLLTTVPFVYPYRRPETDLNGRAPLIALRSDGTYHSVRRAPDLVGSPVVEVADTVALYKAVRLWSTLLDDPAHAVTMRLSAGDMAVFNNHRLLHGRTGFELGASGRRTLLGAYLGIDELRSRRRLLGRAAGAS